jgi:hypothetical protein
MLARYRSTSYLVLLALCSCHRAPEPPANKSSSQTHAVGNAAPQASLAPVAPQSLHERIDELQNAPPKHPPPDNVTSIVVWHVLIAYQGAAGAPATVTRTKDEARALAGTVQLQVAAGADFDTVALKYSDDPNLKTDHGKLGKIGRNERDKAFTDYAFALLKFETGPVPLDTPAGFEVIRRME